MSSSTASFSSTIETYPATVKTFSISELEKATENFSFSKIIGEGGYGRVYRGVIDDDDVEVAVKLLTRKHQNRDREFVAEVEMLSRLHHRNLVKLIVQFCRYVAPEYAMTGHLLVKSDVYSYGVVLLELLSGRKPVDMTQPPGSENLVTWARPLLTSREGLQRLVDPSMPSGYDFEKLAKAAAIASMCVHVEASHRPFMGEVVQALKLIHTGGGGATEASSSSSPWRDGSRSTWNDEGPATSPAFPRGYCSDPAGGAEETPPPRPRSASSAVLDKIESLAMYDWSGPLRAKGRHSFYRLRGSMSEHGRPSDDGSVEGYWM
ncbi:hypothetical protein PR202_gb15066 [Eleusine coracana subsp. coracana]|uniref:Protein kinase domain-containing protein n=1 Tax=Eleusine coracana subsp. coracana TaxID=191504 RepID=A0AAV5EX05_ELECO|nr:hypothetical protein PR202_gb15066 [Eleusine coracana subsp. coracana]